MASQTDKVTVSTDEIGTKLKETYGRPSQRDQDKHIDYFYLRVGKQIAHKTSDVFSELDLIQGLKEWKEVEEWPGLFFGKFCKSTWFETERHREESLNFKVRHPLIDELQHRLGGAKNPLPIHAMFHRACLYHNYEIEHEVTTDEVGDILDKACSADKDKNPHRDFFYLMVQKKNTDKVFEILTVFKSLPGDWRKVQPKEKNETQDTWPDTFFGYFPKTPFDTTERKREERLNRDVRLPLIETLEKQVTSTRGGDPNKPGMQVYSGKDGYRSLRSPNT